MSFFEKSKIDLKKYYIIHSLASACAISVGLPLCFSILFLVIRGCEHYAADCIFADGFPKNGPKYWKAILRNFWLVVFLGMFWNSISAVGEIDTPTTSVRWSSIECRRRMAQKMVAEVGRPFCAILGSIFLGDVLNIDRRTSEKHYSTLEFKVIDIV